MMCYIHKFICYQHSLGKRKKKKKENNIPQAAVMILCQDDPINFQNKDQTKKNPTKTKNLNQTKKHLRNFRLLLCTSSAVAVFKSLLRSIPGPLVQMILLTHSYFLLLVRDFSVQAVSNFVYNHP